MDDIDYQLAAIRRLSMQELLGILNRAGISYAGRESYDYLVQAVQDLVTVYGSQVIDVTVGGIEGARGATAPIVAADPMKPAQVEGVVGWAMSRQDVRSALAGSVLRLVQQPGRETVVQSAEAAGHKYYRQVSAGACSFCLMLASRGGVYRSSRTAGVGNAFHDHCRCRIVELSAGTQLPAMNQHLSELWGKVASGEPNPRKSWDQYWSRRDAPLLAA